MEIMEQQCHTLTSLVVVFHLLQCVEFYHSIFATVNKKDKNVYNVM